MNCSEKREIASSLIYLIESIVKISVFSIHSILMRLFFFNEVDEVPSIDWVFLSLIYELIYPIID